MKTILTLCLTVVITTLSIAQEKEQATTTVTVHIENVLSDKGTIHTGLYTEDTFMKAAPNYSSKDTIKDGKVTLIFKNVPAGTYAISSYHDENDNNQMDFETTGMPKEDYWVSNNPADFGPPQWETAKFTVGKEPVILTLKQ
ncbi:DUF2141 domain-containing protein [Gangjinia marincola]|uniref:DUF2141 domain-containing protein n=1 Tax=Gangjinia marincola TaxID=578463 RepID=A0ABN1MHA7_9FLAO